MIVFLRGTSYSLAQTLLLQDVWFSHNAQRHRQTDGRTDRRQYDANIHLYFASRQQKNNKSQKETKKQNKKPTVTEQRT